MKIIYNRILKGINLGLKTETLPNNIKKFQELLVVRIFRIMGGISTLILLSDLTYNFSNYLLFLCLFSIIFFIYYFIIGFYRIKHIYMILRSDKLDIRNSPLDQLARLSARVVLCAKGLCEQTQIVGIAMGILLGIDTILEKSDQEAIFGPIIASGLKKVLPNNEAKTKITELIKGPVSQIDNNNQEIDELNKFIDNISTWNNNDKEIKKSISDLVNELNKRKDTISKNNNELRNEINKLLNSNPFKK